ncbi:MAG: hypothetical protein ACP5OE_09930 [Thermodesulfobium sp.]
MGRNDRKVLMRYVPGDLGNFAIYMERAPEENMYYVRVKNGPFWRIDKKEVNEFVQEVLNMLYRLELERITFRKVPEKGELKDIMKVKRLVPILLKQGGEK